MQNENDSGTHMKLGKLGEQRIQKVSTSDYNIVESPAVNRNTKVMK